MKKFIIKRDGTNEDYDINKINNVLIKAFANTNTDCDLRWLRIHGVNVRKVYHHCFVA